MSIATRAQRHFIEASMVDTIWNQIRNPKPVLAKEVGTAIACGLEKAGRMWLAAQQVNQVIGMGLVPAFAPPYVPVGPVVGGSIVGTPGHLRA